jgi:hypothetical protein
MAERDIWEDRRRSYEAEYFQRRERELIDKMRERAAREAQRKELAESVGVSDDDVLRGLEELGYTRDTVTLLHLVPLLHVAWIDGSVSQAERDRILEVARLRGVERGSTAHRELEGWLARRPAEGFFEDTLRLIGNLLQVLPDAERDRSRQDLVEYSAAIARASGGLLGLGTKVSREERELLDKIARQIEQAHASASKQVVR